MLRLLGLRYLLQRWDRAALVAASIALGVATLVSSRTLNQCIGAASAGTTTPLAGADFYVSNGELGVQLAVADDLRAANVPGVATVEPRVFERVLLPDLGGRGAVLVGAELSADAAGAGAAFGAAFVRTLPADFASAALLLTRTPVVVSKPLHDAWVAGRASPDAPLRLRSGSRSADCVVAGYVEFAADSPARALGTNVIGMDLSAAARFARPGDADAKVGRIDVRLTPGADPEAARQAVERVTGERAAVRTPETHGRAAQEIVGGIQLGFALCSAGAMVVGLFLVYNALSVTVAERRRDIGILRSLGATRGQVIALFAAGSLALGVVGSLLGIPLGTLLARLILSRFRAELGSLFLNPEVDPGWPTPATVAVAALAGVLTALLAGLIPAIQAAGEDPAGAVRRVAGRAGRLWIWLHWGTCALLIGGGGALILLRHDLPARVGAFGGMMAALVGLLLAAPILVHQMIRVVNPIFRRILPIEARLAADNLLRSPGRTGVVIGAMGAGVAVMVQTAGVGRSNEEPVLQWIDEVLRADLFVFAGQVLEANSSQNPLDPGLVAKLAALPGVERAAGIRYARPEFRNTVVLLVAVDAEAYSAADAGRAGPELIALRPLRLLAGGGRRALVSENFARKHDVAAGESFELPGPRGPVSLEVAAVIRDYSWNRGTVFLDRSLYAELFDDPAVDVCHLFLSPGDDGAARDGVRRYLETRPEVGLTAVDRAAMRGFLAELIERLYALAYLQQIVVGVVASLGVVTSLLISVLQRRRELGLLMAVGATPGQVVRSVLAEAMLMGLFGTALGVMIGVPLEWYVLRVVILEESGFDFPVLFPWKPAAFIAAGSLGVAMLAGLLPARLAVRTRIPEAVAHE